MCKGKFFKFLITAVFFCLTIGNAYSYDDGFGDAQKIVGKYFTIYYAPQVDPANLGQQLNIGFADRILAGESGQDQDSCQAQLAGMLDTLFLRVSGILDMNLYSFRGIIKVCRDAGRLKDVYSTLFDTNLGDRYSFYVADLNTIYICAEHFSRGVVAHEITHAITSHYFAVQPPVRVSEVLAGYVEYQLCRTGQQ